MEIERNANKGVMFENIAKYGTFDSDDGIYIKTSDFNAVRIGGKSELFVRSTIVKPCLIEKVFVSE